MFVFAFNQNLLAPICVYVLHRRQVCNVRLLRIGHSTFLNLPLEVRK